MNKILAIILLSCFPGVLPANGANDIGMYIVNAARQQIGKTIYYDPARDASHAGTSRA